MKIWKKALSVGLSLALCASMVLPSFAAVALNETYIDGATGELLENEEKNYDYYLENDFVLDKTLVVKNGVNASLDLNGYTLMLNDASVVEKDADGYTTGIKAADSSGKTKVGAVIKVEGEDTKLTVTDEGVDGVQKGDGIGTITGGNNTGTTEWWIRKGSGGGVYVIDGATFEMSGGKVSGNITSQQGGGIAAIRSKGLEEITTVVLNNVEISDNVSLASDSRNTGAGGGGVYIDGWSEGTLTNTKIINNYSDWAGGGLYGFANARITVNGGEISHNNSVALGGGVRVCGSRGLRAVVEMNDVKLNQNRVSPNGGGAIAGTVADITLNNVVATNNVVAGNAGGLHFSNTVQLTVKGNNQTYDNTIGEGMQGKDIYSDAEIISVGGGNINNVLPDGYIGDEGNIHEGNQWYAGWSPDPNYVPPNNNNGDDPNNGNGGNGGDNDDITLADEEIPLAGIFTRGDAIGYLWRQAGEPEAELSDFEDVPEDHEWAVAIGWAQDMGIARADEEGNFRPDDLVLRSVESLEISPEGELQEFLNWYAAYAGVELDEGELFIQLAGAWDDVIMGEEAQVIFDDFFAKLEAALSQAA